MRTTMKKQIGAVKPRKKKGKTVATGGILKKTIVPLAGVSHKPGTSSSLVNLDTEEEDTKDLTHVCRKCKRLLNPPKKCTTTTTPKPKVSRDGKLSDDSKREIRMIVLKAILPKRQHGFAKKILERFQSFSGMQSEGIRALAGVTLNGVTLGRVNAARLWALVE